jgi:hypothetical protein
VTVGNRSLLGAADGVVGELERLEVTPAGGSEGVHFDQDHELARRVPELGRHLRAVLTLQNVGAYGSAFAVARVALEHHVVDELLFHGEQIPVRNPAGEPVGSLSKFWVAATRHRPMLGPPTAQEFVHDGVIELDVLRGLASANRDLYQSDLRWGALLQQLEASGRWNRADVGRLEVHYRFLSVFVHATYFGTELLGAYPVPDHYCDELLGLYAASVAARELTIFTEYLARSSKTVVARAVEADAASIAAQAQSAHLWFLDGAPQAFDRWAEVNRRKFQILQGVEDVPAVVPPGDVPDDELGYYAHPLRRIHRMHSSMTDLSGYAYVSPWPLDEFRPR